MTDSLANDSVRMVSDSIMSDAPSDESNAPVSLEQIISIEPSDEGEPADTPILEKKADTIVPKTEEEDTTNE